MAKIPGRPGKSDGVPGGAEEFEQEFYTTSQETAAFLRQIADLIEAKGPVSVEGEGWTVGVTPMEPLKLEIQYKGMPMKEELEVQVKLKQNP
ncbi:MAG: amphi-Trp domain-containing protein [Methanosarcinales archaeon]|nr:amphi-Trp domain-containing protein [Methanosarcinales archaeon]